MINHDTRPTDTADLRRRPEEDKLENEGRYKQLFEAESDAILLIDNQTGRILEANSAAQVLYGYGLDELLGKKNTDLSAEPEKTQKVTADTPVNPDPVIKIPLRFHRKKDGAVFPVEITGRFFLWEGRPVHIAAIRDISERKEAQETLCQLNEQLEQRVRQRTAELAELEATITRSPVVVFRRENSPGFPVIFVTENISQFGFRAEEIMARRLDRRQMVHPDDVQRMQMELAQHVSNGTAEFSTQIRFITPSGDIRWIEDREIAIRNAEGVITHYDGVVLDITERKLAEDRLQESQRHFVALAEHNHRLARELQHRVRNSIQGLIGLVSILRNRMTDVPAFANAMESRLMALAHIQRMLFDTDWGQVDLRELVTSTLDSMQPLAPRLALLDVQGPPVLIGAAQVTPLVLILAEWFTNSCKYGAHASPQGRVAIAWRFADPDAQPRQLHLSWTETGGSAITASITPSLGTELVESFATRELHGRVRLGYPPEGVRHSLIFPTVA